VQVADGRVTWSRFETLVDGAIAASDPEATAERERRARSETFARPTRSTEDGMRGFYVRAHFAVIARLDATVDHLADALGALGISTSNDERRALAMLVLATPRQAVRILDAYHQKRSQSPPDLSELLPEVVVHVVHVHTYRGPEPSAGVVRVEGVGSVTETWVREFLGPLARFEIQPVMDIEGPGSGRRLRDPRPT
jgi:hypothetical protein